MKKKLDLFSKYDKETENLLKHNSKCIKDILKIKKRNNMVIEADAFKNV